MRGSADIADKRFPIAFQALSSHFMTDSEHFSNAFQKVVKMCQKLPQATKYWPTLQIDAQSSQICQKGP